MALVRTGSMGHFRELAGQRLWRRTRTAVDIVDRGVLAVFGQ